jgi:PhzF family phenazine biosynthesis protein
MAIPIIQVDAFTDQPFMGNPAAVCILPGRREERWMQQVAQEMNLSETAFLYPEGEDFQLRWFTPTIEVDLCGHATLASAHVLWEEGYLKAERPARFHTRSGLLTAERKGRWIEMDFPAEPEVAATAPPHLIQALGVTPKYVGRNRFDYLIEVDSEETVRKMKPDFPLLKTISARGVMVTSRSDAPQYDFVSRFFGPAAGIDEDPVTGSAHCCLGPFWKGRLNKSEFIAYQASARGGVVRVRVVDSRVYLGGQAVTLFRGTLADACHS